MAVADSDKHTSLVHHDIGNSVKCFVVQALQSLRHVVGFNILYETFRHKLK